MNKKENPPMQARKGGHNKKGYKLNIPIIHKSKSELQVVFKPTFTKLIKKVSDENQISAEKYVLLWIQRGLNRDYLNKRL